MQLPYALSRWASILQLFAPEAARVLATWLPRIDAAIGPLLRSSDPGGEPDGYDGLTRRGTYERLLASEWALAEEYPDEFMRRALAHEHSFLQLARRSPRAQRTQTVLFDCGPLQLGSPRLAQLALLIVLERRLGSNVSLAWGTLQAPKLANDALDAQALRQFLGARSLMSPSASDLDHWRARDLSPIVVAPLDVPSMGERHRIAIEPDLDARSLQLSIVRRGAVVHQVELPLPPHAIASNVFREIASGERAITHRTSILGGLLFTDDGGRLFVRKPGGALALHVPAAANEEPARIRHVEGKDWLVAVGRLGGGSILALFCSDDGLYFRERGVLTRIPSPSDIAISKQGEAKLRRIHVLRPGRYLIGDDYGNLYRLTNGELTALQLRSTAVCGGYGKTFAIASGAQSLSLYEITETTIWRGQITCDSDGKSFFCRLRTGPPIFAARVAVDRYRVGTADRFDESRTLSPGDAEVFGCTGVLGHPGLVVLESDARTVSAITRNHSIQLPRSSSRIIDVAVNVGGTAIAYETVDRDIVVVDIASKHERLRFRGKA